MKSIDHVAIIMDGNGRWANLRKRPRFWGHLKGAQIISSIVSKADELEVKALTMYAFSTENWSRSEIEINFLFKLLKKFLIKEKDSLIKNRVQFRVIGDIKALASETQKLIQDLEEQTRSFEGLKLSFAFSYGGQDEIVDAVNAFIQNSPNKSITKYDILKYLYRPDSGDVDLIIRTGGDMRISNFMLWQSAYAELFFSNTMWPDFSVSEFESIINNVKKRERKFGHAIDRVLTSNNNINQELNNV
jgi:undecaprenyl diphosphate synthase